MLPMGKIGETLRRAKDRIMPGKPVEGKVVVLPDEDPGDVNLAEVAVAWTAGAASPELEAFIVPFELFPSTAASVNETERLVPRLLGGGDELYIPSDAGTFGDLAESWLINGGPKPKLPEKDEVPRE
jgi:hypothetical protein